MGDEGWEQRMSERARTRADALWRRQKPNPYGVFAKWLRPDDPEDILPEILAARCLGIEYGDPGPRLPAGQWPQCRECWSDRYMWYGNTWGLKHIERQPGDPLFSFQDLFDCKHQCHESDPPMIALAC